VNKPDHYLKIVEWSDEDGCFVGRCPELMLGGVHGDDERDVFSQLCDAINEWVAIAEQDGEPLPAGLANKKYSGKFNLRLDQSLHKRLAMESVKAGMSLDAYCAEALESALRRQGTQGARSDAAT